MNTEFVNSSEPSSPHYAPPSSIYVDEKQIWGWTQVEGQPWSPAQRAFYTCVVVTELLGSGTTISLLIKRRKMYPINATPVIWNILSHFTPPICGMLFGTEKLLIFMHSTPVAFFFLYAAVSWPMVPAICARLLYIWRSYEQQVNIEQRQPLLSVTRRDSIFGADIFVVEKHRYRLSKDQEASLFFVFVSILTLLFPFAVNLDIYILHYHRDFQRFIQVSPGLALSWFVLFMYCFLFAFLALKIKGIKEEFNLKAQYLCFAVWVLIFYGGVLIMLLLGLHRVNGTMLLVTRLLAHFANMGCTLFCGVMPLAFSLREEWRMRRRLLLQHQSAGSNKASNRVRASSITAASAVYTVRSINDLKRILIHTDNAMQLEAFQKYTVKEFCVENVVCLRAIMRLNLMTDKKTLLHAVRQIVNDHVISGVRAEVNLSATLRQNIIDAVSQLTEETVANTIFQEMEYELYLMILDSFNRFLVKENVVLNFVPSQSLRF